MLLLMIMMSITAFLICRYARLIIKNIKQEVYFAISNSNLLKKLLISVAGYTIFFNSRFYYAYDTSRLVH